MFKYLTLFSESYISVLFLQIYDFCLKFFYFILKISEWHIVHGTAGHLSIRTFSSTEPPLSTSGNHEFVIL